MTMKTVQRVMYHDVSMCEDADEVHSCTFPCDTAWCCIYFAKANLSLNCRNQVVRVDT